MHLIKYFFAGERKGKYAGISSDSEVENLENLKKIRNQASPIVGFFFATVFWPILTFLFFSDW